MGGKLAAANSFGLYSFANKTYLVGNASTINSRTTQGFSSASGDILIDVTGFSGTLDADVFIN